MFAFLLYHDLKISQTPLDQAQKTTYNILGYSLKIKMKKTKKSYFSNVSLALLIGVVAVGLGTSSIGEEGYLSVVNSSKAAPSKFFLASSFTKTKAADKYTRTCVVTAGKATPTEALTSDEQVDVDSFNSVVGKFKAKNVETFMIKEKKIFASREKINVLGTKSVKIFMDNNGIYYPGATAGKWKAFKNEDMLNGMFESVDGSNVTSYFDKKSMSFLKWETKGKARTAVYSAKLNADGNSDLITSSFGTSLVEGQDIASVKLSIDEKSQMWTKYEAVIQNLKSGKIKFPLKGVCQMTYGNAVKVNIPKNVEWVDMETGVVEMIDAMNTVE